MSRSCYSDEYGDDFPGQMELYRANVRRSIRSKAGQARLSELRDALLALPAKELEANIFAEGTREKPRVCALGAWAWVKKQGDPSAAMALLKDGRDSDDLSTYESLSVFGWPKLVVFDAIYENDAEQYIYQTVEGPQQHRQSWPLQIRRPETTSERYVRVLKWVEEQISPSDVA